MSARGPLPGLLLLLLVATCCGGGGGGGGDVPAVPQQLPPQEAEPNDLPADANDLGTLGSSTLVEGQIARTGSTHGLPSGDLDLFRFTPGASGVLRAELHASPESDFDLGLFDATGRRLATARTTGPAENLYARVEQDRALLIQVGGYSGKPDAYELVLYLTPAAGPATHPDPSPLSEARCFHGMAALPGGGAIVGGGTKNAGSPEQAFLGGIASTEIFEPETGKFTLGPNLGVTRFGVTVTTLADGRVLFAGGDVAGTALLFSPETGAMEGEPIPMPGGMRALHTATLLPDGRVLLAGGAKIVLSFPPSSQKLATTTIFDPKTAACTAGPSLTAVRFSHAACLLADGRVLITGGEKRATSEIIDLLSADPQSVVGPALTANRDDHSATLLPDGRVLIAGGQQSGGTSVDTAEILDDVTASPTSAFRKLNEVMSTSRADHVAILLPRQGGKVILLGGELDPASGPDVILTAVDLFDPATETFSALPDLKNGRDDHRAVLLTDGRILVTGGEDEAAKAIAAVETYLTE